MHKINHHFDLYYGGKSAVEVLNDGDEAKSQKVQKFKVDEIDFVQMLGFALLQSVAHLAVEAFWCARVVYGRHLSIVQNLGTMESAYCAENQERRFSSSNRRKR